MNAMATSLQDIPPFTGHSPQQPRPLGSYGVLTGVYSLLCGGYAAWFARTGRSLPDEVSSRDLALGAIATHKVSRLITRDRVTSIVRAPFTEFQEDAGAGEVEEAARGTGMRRAIGELLVCPYCLAMWIATVFLMGLLVAPRATRAIVSPFVVLTGSDMLQVAYRKAEDLI
jgi:hypothetical protein